MSDKSIWHPSERKYKPINKQAALIVRKARPEHLPPPEPEVFGPYMNERQRAIWRYQNERRARELRITEAICRELAQREEKAQRKLQADAERERQKQLGNNTPSTRWMAKQIKKLEKAVEKARVARYGLLTTAEGSGHLRTL